MFKTIFSKLIAIFMAIMIFSFTVSGVMLYFFLGNFVTSDKENILIQKADKINSFFTFYMENQSSQSYPFMRKILENLLDSESGSANTKSYIWVVDDKGYISYFSPKTPDHIRVLEKYIDATGAIRLPDEQQYKKVLSGQYGVVKETGDFYGFFKMTGISSWLTIEKPYKYIDATDGKEKVLAAVYVHTPIPEINKVQWSVFKLFMFSVSISVLIAIILVYIFSNKITKPLKEINEAAKIIAKGDFNKQLNINTKDEIGELADSFNHMVYELENLEEMRRGFIANISHELRTPMTSIRGFIEGMLDGTIPPEKHQDYLSIVRDETNRLNRLINDLMDLAKMEAGENQLTFINFNINELIRRSIIKLESLIVKKNIQIEADFEEEELYVNADMDAMERVIINLMHNAIKFTQESGKISLSTSKRRGKILVSIEDNGIGINEDEIGRIWERFYKSDKSRSRDKSGVGLGLAIVKNIINEHSQDIWVESESGKGTKFSFTLNNSNEDNKNFNN